MKMPPMDLTGEYPDLAAQDIAFLQKIEGDLPILADLSRADILVYVCPPGDRAVVAAQARPHSVSPIYDSSVIGRAVKLSEEPALFRAARHGGSEPGRAGLTVASGPAVQEIYPLRNANGLLIGLASVETNAVEYERHSRRNVVFRRALAQLKSVGLRGQLVGAAELTPFEEHDGIIFVDHAERMRYVSGVAENLHRRLGYTHKLVNGTIKGMRGHEAIYEHAMTSLRCVEEEAREGELIWVRKALPFSHRPAGRQWPWPTPAAGTRGVLITIHDATEARRKEQELRIKAAMIQEIHHRVKNNLQTIAALLRLQARRVPELSAQVALHESVGRILSVAVVHEFLSHDDDASINIRDVSQRILAQTEEGILEPGKRIKLALQGDSFALPAQRATACALVINELVQNAVEHGYTHRLGGAVQLSLREEESDLVVEVIDDGEGLPPGFDLDRTTSLGLKIVQTLVREDLKGTLELSNGKGVRATVRIPKRTA